MLLELLLLPTVGVTDLLLNLDVALALALELFLEPIYLILQEIPLGAYLLIQGLRFLPTLLPFLLEVGALLDQLADAQGVVSWATLEGQELRDAVLGQGVFNAVEALLEVVLLGLELVDFLAEFHVLLVGLYQAFVGFLD